MCLVQNSSMPLPLLSSVLDVLFRQFHVPVVSLFSSAAMSVAASGLRSGLVVDMGWSETIVTSVYEHREVRSTRSIRAAQRLVAATHNVILTTLGIPTSGNTPTSSIQDMDPDDSVSLYLINLEECEDICRRLMWCRQFLGGKIYDPEPPGLPTVSEQDESDTATSQGHEPAGTIDAPLNSIRPPQSVSISFDALANACEEVFIAPGRNAMHFDDHELPLHFLIYQHLLGLPMDVRAVCMSRIIFTGGCSNVLGLKGRIFDEVDSLIKTRGWVPVSGKAFGKTNSNANAQPSSDEYGKRRFRIDADGEVNEDVPSPANVEHERDSVMEKIQKTRLSTDPIHGELRSVESLGSWAGGSLMANLKVMGLATIEREKWQQQGIRGASRPKDVDTRSQLRHSASGLTRVQPSSSSQSWTLGAWGYL